MLHKCPECGYTIRIQICSDDHCMTTRDGVMGAELDYNCPKCQRPLSVVVMVGYEPISDIGQRSSGDR